MLIQEQRAVLEHIVEQHAEEAAFLWTLRDAATDAPHYKRQHLGRLDARVEAHLDGLRVAGQAGRRIALAQLDRRCEKGELFVAGFLALESGDARLIESLIAFAAEAEPEVRRGFEGAVGWCSSRLLAPTVRRWNQSEAPFERYLALSACSTRRADAGAVLAARLTDPHPLPRARAFRLLGELGKRDYLATCLGQLSDSDADVAYAAARSAVLLGDRNAALDALIHQILATGKREALEIAVRALGIVRGADFIRTLIGAPELLDAVTASVGQLGDPAAIPWLIARAADPRVARRAGESISMITGVDLAFGDLDKDSPTSAEEETFLQIASGDEALPLPDPARLKDWWRQMAGSFATGVRHLCGHPIDQFACDQVWSNGFQRQRRAATFELKMSRPDTVLRNWRERCLIVGSP